MKINENKDLWMQRVEEFKSSSLTQTAWCRNNEINISALRYWLRKLDNIPITTAANSSEGFEFASVSIAENQTSSTVTLEIKDVKLSITNDYDEVLLLKLIKTLKKL